MNNDHPEENACGIGRGRGWLKINNANNKENIKKPGGLQDLVDTETPKDEVKVDLNITSSKFLAIINNFNSESDYDEICSLWITEWIAHCSDEDVGKMYFEHIYNICIRDMDLALKLLKISMYSRKGEIGAGHPTTRKAFVNQLQKNYEDVDKLREKDVLLCRNTILLFGFWIISSEYTIKYVKFMINNLKKLLEWGEEEDIKLYTKILYLILFYGYKEISIKDNEQLEQIVKNARDLLIDGDLTKKNKLYLLLSIEFFLKKSKDVMNVYKDKLDEDDLKFFKMDHTVVVEGNEDFTRVNKKKKKQLKVNKEINEERIGRPILGSGVRHVKEAM